MLGKKCLTVLFVVQTMLAVPASAGVNFILNHNEIANSSNERKEDGDLAAKCHAQGFPVSSSSCTGATLPGLLCPLSPAYTDECCSNRYSYVVTSSCSNGTRPSSDTCGGRYKCICDPIIYPKGYDRERCTGKFTYDEVNYCAETYTDESGVRHEVRYFKNCTCSANYARCNSSYRLHGVGDSCSYNGNIYYASCACDSGYNKLCEASGAKDSSDYCLFNSKKYYRLCNSNEEDNKTDSDTMNSTDQ